MRCKYCDSRLRAGDYEWNQERGCWEETGIHRDGSCVDVLGPDKMLDVTGYDYLDDFEEA